MLHGFSNLSRMRRSPRACVLLVALSLAPLGSAQQEPARENASEPVRTNAAPQLTATQQAEFARAQQAAQQILAGAEFQRAGPTWWDRVKAKIEEAILGLFLGIDRVSSRSPWLGRALEWLLFGAAAVGLLVWLLRTVQRQRLRVALGNEPAKTAQSARESEDWRRLAEQEAAKGAWREAIHALYWAAVVHLEHRRAWRHNPARTPREYVRLLRAGSAEQRDLRALTGALERSWYGQRDADASEFEEARQNFERIASETVAGGEA